MTPLGIFRQNYYLCEYIYSWRQCETFLPGRTYRNTVWVITVLQVLYYYKYLKILSDMQKNMRL